MGVQEGDTVIISGFRGSVIKICDNRADQYGKLPWRKVPRKIAYILPFGSDKLQCVWLHNIEKVLK